MRRWIGVVIAAAMASLVWSADPWSGTEPRDWQPKQMERFLTHSPWSKSVPVQLVTKHNDGSVMVGGAGQGSPGGAFDTGGIRRSRDISSDSPEAQLAALVAVVRWESAPMTRKVLAVAEGAEFNKTVESYAKDYYVVSVTLAGLDGSGGKIRRHAANDPSGKGTPTQAPEISAGALPGPLAEGTAKRESERLEQLRRDVTQTPAASDTTLRFGRETVHPEKTELVSTSTGHATLFLFPRALKLEESDGTLRFETSMGAFTVKMGFQRKELSTGAL